MSRVEFEGDCPGCEPVMMNPKTGEVFPKNHPNMVAMMKVWQATSLAEKQAFHRVCCLDSRAKKDLLVMNKIAVEFKKATSS